VILWFTSDTGESGRESKRMKSCDDDVKIFKIIDLIHIRSDRE